MSARFLINLGPPKVGNSLGVFLMVLGAKLWLVTHFGSAVPLSDQWDAEAVALFKPLTGGTLTLSSLFSPHNEHRILLTRLWSLLLWKCNAGHWDPMVEMAAQALLHCAAIAIFVGICAPHLEARRRTLFVLFTGALFLFPFGWENTLWGFQSQFYFVALFGILCLWLNWKHETLSVGWWLGVVAGVCGLFSMASGVGALVAAAGIPLMRAWLKPASWRRQLAGMAVYGLLVTVFITTVPRVEELRRPAPAEVGEAFCSILGWPGSLPGGFVLVQLPLAWLALVAVRRRLPAHDGAWLVLAFGTWGWVSSFAIAYGRGNVIAHRYSDTFCLGLCTLAAAAALLPIPRQRAWPRRLGALIGMAWSFYVILSLTEALAGRVWPDAQRTIARQREGEANVAAYLRTRDPAHLIGKPLPYPREQHLHKLLDDPALVAVLPDAIRPPLPWTPATNSSGFFPDGFERQDMDAHGDDSSWGSYGPEGNAHQGEISLALPPASESRWLRFYVSGYPRRQGMSLAIVDVRGHTRKIVPPGNPRNHWIAESIRVPAGDLTLRVKDGNPKAWIAFTAFREVGPLSLLVAALDQNIEAMIFALGLSFLVIAGCFPSQRTPPDLTIVPDARGA